MKSLIPIKLSPVVRARLLLFVGYPAFFVFCLLMFGYCTFPYDTLRDYIVQEVERPADVTGHRRSSGYELQIEDMGPAFLMGVSLEGVRFTKLAETPEDRPLSVSLDEAELHVSLLSLLFGDIDASFDAEVGDGSIEGEYEADEETVHIEAELDEVDLQRLEVFSGLVGLPVQGIATGEVDLTVASTPAETTGNGTLSVAGLTIGDGRAKLKLRGMSSGLTVERVDAGTLSLSMVVREGVAHFERLQADGRDLELEGSGTIRLLNPLKLSRLDMMLRFKFNDAYKNRNDRTRGLFTIIEYQPQIRAARTPDGWLQYRIDGTFGTSVHSTPAGGSRRLGNRR